MITAKPNSIFVICGDFNSDSNPLPFLYNYNNENIKTFNRKKKTKSVSSLTDWILCNKDL